ncbi:hypothetical protein GAYE_SCF35G5116 [Galdieria yellowstonensis]|uniref:Uncharacterized protein n=1 Tax=Galdieria yellowstonensis TaxID=3028027 RepID=A0AAV9IIQ6_9RHOD|nr:hypothetical protein GAYE_SCF35G5116 [Galdieria yellowstonensis]
MYKPLLFLLLALATKVFCTKWFQPIECGGKLTSALPPLFGVSQDSPDIVCTSLITCFLIRGTCRGALEKWSCPLTCVPLKAVFACRDCKFSVVEKLNSLRAQDKVSRRQWQLQGKDIPVVEKYRHLGIDLNTSLSAKGFILQLQIQRYVQ